MIQSYKQLNDASAYLEHADIFTPNRYRQFFRHFPGHGKIVLDVGCNTGRGGMILKELNPNIQLIGLDCLDTLLKHIPPNIYEKNICSYSTDIAIKNSSVDVIVAGEFIEHLYPNDVLQTLSEFYRVTKPGGRVLLTTPNPNYLLLKLTGQTVLRGAHVSEHYPKQLSKALKEVGFMSTKILGTGKVSNFIGENFPLLMLYGSYLIIANKT